MGKGATVGSAIATKGAIIPAAVGADVGCGMVAVKTKFFASDLPDNLDKIRTGIERRIPLGAGAGNKSLTDTAIERVKRLRSVAKLDYDKVDKNWIGARPLFGSAESQQWFRQRAWVFCPHGRTDDLSLCISNVMASRHRPISEEHFPFFPILCPPLYVPCCLFWTQIDHARIQAERDDS